MEQAQSVAATKTLISMSLVWTSDMATLIRFMYTSATTIVMCLITVLIDM